MSDYSSMAYCQVEFRVLYRYLHYCLSRMSPEERKEYAEVFDMCEVLLTLNNNDKDNTL